MKLASWLYVAFHDQMHLFRNIYFETTSSHGKATDPHPWEQDRGVDIRVYSVHPEQFLQSARQCPNKTVASVPGSEAALAMKLSDQIAQHNYPGPSRGHAAVRVSRGEVRRRLSLSRREF